MVQSYLENHSSVPERTFGKFLEWLVPQTPIFGMKLPECFDLIGSGVGLEDYRAAIASKRQDASATVGGRPITRRAHARVGLMGNPSDGFNGKTISVSIENYWAEATIVQSERLVLQPHPLNDPSSFGSLADLYGISRQEGYQGGMRLMQATCKKFFEYCSEHGIAVARRNFTLSYDTNVPRQVGLAGSSAIVTACLKCLLAFFNLTEQDIPKADRPSFVLAIEMQELGINAGLQDRVIQIYDGCVYMDFDKELMDAQGHGKYEYIALDKVSVRPGAAERRRLRPPRTLGSPVEPLLQPGAVVRRRHTSHSVPWRLPRSSRGCGWATSRTPATRARSTVTCGCATTTATPRPASEWGDCIPPCSLPCKRCLRPRLRAHGRPSTSRVPEVRSS